MARIRTIKPKFWDDVKLAKVSRDARLLFIGMWNFSDDMGVIIAEPIWLKSKIFPYDNIQIQQFEKWIQELVKNGFISPLSYKQDGFYYLPNLTRHQVINRPNYEDVNIEKTVLERLLNDSMNNHGTFTDDSVQERKGEEGKGKERKGTREREDSILIFPFDSENFKQQWEIWKKFKEEEFRFRFKGLISEQAALKGLSDLANGDEQMAIDIIHQSISNGWQGFFELKNKTNGVSKNKQRPGDIAREAMAILKAKDSQ